MEANNTLGFADYAYERLLKDRPDLANVTSISEVSKALFGIKTLTALALDYDYGSKDDVKRLNEFFAGNHSGLTEWAKKAKRGLAFYVTVEHRKIYNRMVRDLGLDLVIRFSQDRDFADIATGYEFVSTDKRRKAAFVKDIIGALSLFPESAHSKMIHDYFVDRMKAAERKQNPRTKVPLVPTLPIPANVSEEIGDYKVLVPKHETDLRRIGNAQNHCVGTAGMGYASKVRRGDVWIFALYSKTLKDGVCVEVTKSGHILQAQGQHRRSPSGQERIAITEVIQQLMAG